MNNKDILNKINKIINVIKHNELMKKLQYELIVDIANEEAAKDPGKNIVKEINKQLKAISKEMASRQIFANAVYQEIDGVKRLCFTNSYYLIALKEQDIFVNVVNPSQKLLDDGMAYPKLESFLKIGVYEEITKNFDKKEINEKILKYGTCKENKKDNMYHLENNDSWYDINYLKRILDIIGYDNITIQYTTCNTKPIILKNKNDDIGLILPIRNIEQVD